MLQLHCRSPLYFLGGNFGRWVPIKRTHARRNALCNLTWQGNQCKYKSMTFMSVFQDRFKQHQVIKFSWTPVVKVCQGSIKRPNAKPQSATCARQVAIASWPNLTDITWCGSTSYFSWPTFHLKQHLEVLICSQKHVTLSKLMWSIT